jgi:hypothetical protein
MDAWLAHAPTFLEVRIYQKILSHGLFPGVSLPSTPWLLDPQKTDDKNAAANTVIKEETSFPTWDHTGHSESKEKEFCAFNRFDQSPPSLDLAIPEKSLYRHHLRDQSVWTPPRHTPSLLLVRIYPNNRAAYFIG